MEDSKVGVTSWAKCGYTKEDIALELGIDACWSRLTLCWS